MSRGAPLAERSRAWITALGLLALAGVAAMAVGAVVIREPLIALALPAAFVGAIACRLWPAAAVLGVFLVTGALGSLIAFTPLPVVGLADLLLASLWAGVIWTYFMRQRAHPLWIWPGIAAPALYLGVTALQIVTSESIRDALAAFRLSAWYMLAVLLMAIAPWPPATFRRIARGVAVIAVLVGTYAVYRWYAGSAQVETAVAHDATPYIPVSELRFFGPFPSAHQLSAWCATILPFSFALMLGWPRPWRLVAGAGVGVCSFAVLASGVRAGVLAALAGMALVLALYQVSRSFPGPRLGTALAAICAVALIGAVGYELTVGTSAESEERFSTLLSPAEDPGYQLRLVRWEAMFDDINEAPFGHGLGSTGAAEELERDFGPHGVTYTDSSYLKIGLEQGVAVMALFILGLLALLSGLAQRAVRTSDPARATLAIGSCGTLLSLIVLFYIVEAHETVTALAAWILVGIGVAQFTSNPDELGHRAGKA